MKALVKLTFFILLSNAIALKMFKNNNNDTGKKVISGLKYKGKQDEKMPVLSNSLTVCIRFNIKRYGVRKNRGQILTLGNRKFIFLEILARYPKGWLVLGNSNHGNEFTFWRMLYDPKRKSYPMWKLYNWHHICFSYSKQTSHISFVQVRKKIIAELESKHSNSQFSILNKKYLVHIFH